MRDRARALGPRDRGEARESGDLLRARRRLREGRRGAFDPEAVAPAAGRSSTSPDAVLGEHTTASTTSRSASATASASPSDRKTLRPATRPAYATDGRRRRAPSDLDCGAARPSTGVHWISGEAPRGGGPTCACRSAIATWRPAREDRAGARRDEAHDPLRRAGAGRSRRARPPSSTTRSTMKKCWAAVGWSKGFDESVP